jgi:hypothetical protein
MPNLPKNIMITFLAQGQLNLLSTCPRKFQYLYLDRFTALPTLEQQQRMTWGTQFHLLMQQQELGLPIEVLLEGNPALKQSFEALQKTAPDLFNFTVAQPHQKHNQKQGYDQESEHPRSLNLQGYTFMVVYDRLITTPDRAEILDWKTYPRPQNSQQLAQNWQTRLYPYVLVETSDYEPEQIVMTYWFVQSSGERQPQSLRFPYDRISHQQTHQDLLSLLHQLQQWHDRYEQGEAFPQVNASTGICDTCSFAGRCGRDQANPNRSFSVPVLPDIATIPEIPL